MVPSLANATPSATQAGKFTLDELSNPPSKAELSRYEDVPLERLPQKYKRQTDQRYWA